MSILFWRLLFADADLASSATVLDRWHRSFPNLSTPHIKHVPHPRRERAMLRRNECQRLKRAGLLPPADRRAHRLFGDLKQCQCASPTVFQALSPNGYATATREPNHASTSGCPRCRARDAVLQAGKQVQSPIAVLSMSVDEVLNPFEAPVSCFKREVALAHVDGRAIWATRWCGSEGTPHDGPY